VAKRPMSRAEFAAMPRVTPTGLAEARYAETEAHRAKMMPRGPAGLAIPHPRSVYRPTIEATLLGKMREAAIKDRTSTQLPEDVRAAAGAALLDALHRRFPPEEMTVLERWGFAWPHRNIAIRDPEYGQEYVELPEPCLLPKGGSPTFVAAVAYPESEMQIPEGAVGYFRSLREISLLAVRGAGATAWAMRFRREQERYPRWEEIEAAWPLIGEWLADQRRQMKEPRHGR